MQQNDLQWNSVFKISVMTKFGYNNHIKSYFGPVDNLNKLWWSHANFTDSLTLKSESLLFEVLWAQPDSFSAF